MLYAALSRFSAVHQEAGNDKAAAQLLEVSAMVNQAVGDAISGILLVEAALRRLRWTLKDLAALYSDLPSCMLKASCPARITRSWRQLRAQRFVMT